MRRGIAELDGEGEVAGGIVVMRSGKNALETIDAVKAKLASLRSSLPAGVEIVTTYDRSELIKRAVDNLTQKLLEELPKEQQKLVADLVPSQVNVGTLQRLLQALLAERVSIRDLPTILGIILLYGLARAGVAAAYLRRTRT